MTTLRFLLVAMFALAPVLAGAQWHGADVPDSLSFQGFLTDTSGAAVADGDYDLLFKMYKGSNKIWEQNQLNVPVKSGGFNVILAGSMTWPLDTVAFNQAIDLGITINGGTELTPRTPLTSAAYALGMRGMYAVAADDGDNNSPNLLGGASNNFVASGIVGATIGGGGGSFFSGAVPNSVLGNWGTVGGGLSNSTGGPSAFTATVGGGNNNKSSGGSATIGGGRENTATGLYATIPGGRQNSAQGYASLAAGYSASAVHDGSFVWNDRSVVGGNDSLLSTGPNQFLIRAAGGVGIGTNAPTSQLTVHGVVESDSLGFKFPDGTIQTSAAGSSWSLTGNAATTPGTNFIGTTDNTALEIKVNALRALRIERSDNTGNSAPNIIGGASNNYVQHSVEGATIGGGGGTYFRPGFGIFAGPDSILGDWGTIGGGMLNTVRGNWATVGGGFNNKTGGSYATVSGGTDNEASSSHSAIGGGEQNTASGPHATVAGGGGNRANGQSTTIGGGTGNRASGSAATVAGGLANFAHGDYATAPGGRSNKARGDYSLAAGYNAKAGHVGSFVWSDRSQAGITFSDSLFTTADNQFLIRAAGGVGIGTNAPAEALHVLEASGSTAIFLGGDGTAGPHGVIFDDDTANEGVSLLWRTGPNQLIIERGSAGTGADAPDAFVYDRDDDSFRFNGTVGISTDALSKFHVAGNTNGNATATNHIALIDNTSVGISSDVLALRIGRPSFPETTNAFVSFIYNNGTAAGFIRGNGSGGIELISSGSDYAEYLPHLHPNEPLESGDVVGVFAGKITHRTDGADQIMVLSTAPIVVGNHSPAAENDKGGYSRVAFIGQAPVRVRGSIQSGDFLIPSGWDDGSAVAVNPAEIKPGQIRRVFATSWESKDDLGTGSVNAAIGIDQSAAAARAIEALQADAKRREEKYEQQIASILNRLATLEATSINYRSEASGFRPFPGHSRAAERVVLGTDGLYYLSVSDFGLWHGLLHAGGQRPPQLRPPQ